MNDCLFCKIISGELPSDIVYQDEDVLAFRDIEPQAPVHLLVIPKQHIATLLDVGEDNFELLGKLQSTAIGLARELGLKDGGFRLVTNCLEDGGQAVYHLHLHLLGGRAMSWPPG